MERIKVEWQARALELSTYEELIGALWLGILRYYSVQYKAKENIVQVE